MSPSPRQQDLVGYPVDGRAANDHAYIDQVDSATDEEEEPLSDPDDDVLSDLSDDLRVEDEDWEIAERGLSFFLHSLLSFTSQPFSFLLADFTKQYNRLRQHVAVRSHNGSANTIPTSLTKSTLAPLPAINRPITTNAVTAPSRKDKTVDQLAALSKFSSRISKIDQPYDLGVSVNRKGPSQYANLKDKSDRATNEQVLDPRTRIILYKMIGREVIYEVNGCVSTGKEVGRSIPSPPFNNSTQHHHYCILFSPCRTPRPTSTTRSHPQSPTSPSRSTKHPSSSSKTETVMSRVNIVFVVATPKTHGRWSSYGPRRRCGNS